MVHLNIDDIVFLERKKYAIQNALFGPSIGSHVDAMPSAKSLGQTAPFTTLLSDIQNRVKHL